MINMPTPSTIEELYEYRVVKLVKDFLNANEIDISTIVNGEHLEDIMSDGVMSCPIGAMFLDDIQEWMGFDDLLKQVKDS